MNVDYNQLGAVAALLYGKLQNRKEYLRKCEAIWFLQGFEGLTRLRVADIRRSGWSILQPGTLATGVGVLSLRGCTDTHAVMARYRSDGRRTWRYLARTITDICDEAWQRGGFPAVRALYGSDILLRGESRIVNTQTAQGELLYVCDVQGAHLVLTEYFSTGKRRRHEV